MELINYKLLFLLIFLSTKFIIYSYCAIVRTEEQFLRYINKSNEIKIQGEIKVLVNDTLTITQNLSSDLFFGGYSMKTSHLHFLNDNQINLIFECDKVVIQYIIITGNIHFKCKNVVFDYAVLNGYFISKYTLTNSNGLNIPLIELYNSIYNLRFHYGIEVHNANITISNCQFHGNDQYGLYLLKHRNEDNKYHFNCDSSYFEGNYHNNGLYCSNSTVDIYNSKFSYFHGTREMEGYKKKKFFFFFFFK